MWIDQLWRYPVKSMAGERVTSAEVGQLGIAGDRLLYVLDRRGTIVSARTRPRLLLHRATLAVDGSVLVDGLPWQNSRVAAAVKEAAGPGSRLVEAGGGERFDVLPLLVVTDGAIGEFAADPRRLRPNVVIGGVDGLAERDWEGRQLIVEDGPVLGLVDLRGRCVMTTWDPDTIEQDVDVLREIRRKFGGMLGLNAWVMRTGTIHQGAGVQLDAEP